MATSLQKLYNTIHETTDYLKSGQVYTDEPKVAAKKVDAFLKTIVDGREEALACNCPPRLIDEVVASLEAVRDDFAGQAKADEPIN